MVKPIEAEFAKLFNNAYRYIEFAASNQFYMIAKSAGADYQSIMRAMKQNYPRARSFPGPGFGWPCLFKDTMQLVAYARNQFGLGQLPCRSTKASCCSWSMTCGAPKDLGNDRWPAGNGLQGRDRRHPRLAQLQAQAQPANVRTRS